VYLHILHEGELDSQVFSQWELVSMSEILYESEFYEGGMMHEIEL